MFNFSELANALEAFSHAQSRTAEVIVSQVNDTDRRIETVRSVDGKQTAIEQQYQSQVVQELVRHKHALISLTVSATLNRQTERQEAMREKAIQVVSSVPGGPTR